MSFASFLKKLRESMRVSLPPEGGGRPLTASARIPLPNAENVTEFFGKPVQDYDCNAPASELDTVVYRLRIDYETAEEGTIPGGDKNQNIFDQVFDRFLQSPGVAETAALVIGDWGGAGSGSTAEVVIKALVRAKDKLPNLRALFIGDMVSEESEISWIQQTDLSPLWPAYPQLELLQIRGGTGLALPNMALPRLHTLIIQSGGLGGDVVRQVGAANLPELTHLELWLGSDNYGGDSTVNDLKPVLDGAVFPKLDHLGLRDCEYADALATALATAPILGRITVLDLSLGTLSDTGAGALLAAENLKRLRRLDLHYHYLSADMMAKLAGTGVAVELGEPHDGDDDDRYCAVSE